MRHLDLLTMTEVLFAVFHWLPHAFYSLHGLLVPQCPPNTPRPPCLKKTAVNGCLYRGSRTLQVPPVTRHRTSPLGAALLTLPSRTLVVHSHSLSHSGPENDDWCAMSCLTLIQQTIGHPWPRTAPPYIASSLPYKFQVVITV